MNCDDIEKLLAEGRALGPDETKHVAQCASCQSLLDILRTEAEPVSAPVLERILTGLPPRRVVKPLPADPTLIAFTMGIFILFSLVMAIAAGLKGYHHLSVTERILYYAAVLLFGFLFSVSAVQAAIPGSKVRVSRWTAINSSIVGIALLVTAMFRTFALTDFVQQGVPCLRLGCICAAIFGAIAAILLQRGYVTNIRATALLIGCFAGFSGVAVLSLKCPIQNSAHIIVWHLGAVVISGLCGLFIGSMLPDKSRS